MIIFLNVFYTNRKKLYKKESDTAQRRAIYHSDTESTSSHG
ncbi:conserved hypothetical protein [Treponema phagedenis]|uniref:Uncharacterized protein n=1 Tax=Treponema phagedenis TaxID=162 RepID=A0A0B7GRI1_TREPH|nr:conserved hypothetical protein [Treponema phagedenis]